MFTVHPFKIGDKVRCIDASQGLIHGLTYTVKDIMTIHEEEHFVRLEEMDITFWAKRFELVQEESKFKKDDKVRTVLPCCGLSPGKVYTVTKDSDLYTTVLDDNGNKNSWQTNRFELVIEPVFKIGDKVRALSDAYSFYHKCNEFTKGRVYTITNILDPVVEMIDDCGTTNGWNISNFELVIEPEWNIEITMNTWRDGDISLRVALQQAFDAGKKSK